MPPQKKETHPPATLASLPEPGAKDVLYLVDLSGYVYRAYHAVAPLSSSKGEPTHAVLGTVNMLQKIVTERKPHFFAVAMDSRTKTHRETLDPSYKATRPPAPPDLGQQMRRAEEIVRAYNIPVFQQDGYEADDLIASVVRKAEQAGHRVVVVSSDKDLMQLVHDDSPRVLVWDTMRDRVHGPHEVFEKFGVRPSQVRDFLALTGDTSDNVPGVPSVGPKTAADLLGQFGSLEELYARLDDVARPKLQDALRTHEDDARRSQKLVSLSHELPVAYDTVALVYGGANRDALVRLFVELDFHRLLSTLEADKPAVSHKAVRVEVVRTEEALARFLNNAKGAGRLSMRSVLASEEPHRADWIGAALAFSEEDVVYVPFGHRYLGCPPQLSVGAFTKELAALSREVRLVGHDVKREMIVLRRHGLEQVVFQEDTAIQSYLLDPESPHALADLVMKEFAERLPQPHALVEQKKRTLGIDEVDLEEAGAVFGAFSSAALKVLERFTPRLERDGLVALYRDVELPLSSVLSRVEGVGVLVDASVLRTIDAEVTSRLLAIEGEAHAALGRTFSIRSRDQLEAILFDELKLPVVKRTPKGGRSTDAEVLQELADTHPLPKLVLEYRELDKLKGTYVDALPRSIHPKTGRIHTNFAQTVAATGRLSSIDPNLQNIPIRTEVGRSIRRAFVAPEGASLVSADYSQIELRVLAHLSKDPELLSAFQEGVDVHRRTAALIFDVSEEGVTADMRRVAKTINFGVIYGMGDFALARELGIPKGDAHRFIENYFRRYAGVASFLEGTVAKAREGQAVRTLLGRRRFLPNLKSANRVLRAEAERIAKNTPIQGTAADILKMAMVRLGTEPVLPGVEMVLSVHDELVFEVPDAALADAKGRIREVMQSVCKLDVPLVVDVGAGKNWADAH